MLQEVLGMVWDHLSEMWRLMAGGAPLVFILRNTIFTSYPNSQEEGVAGVDRNVL